MKHAEPLQGVRLLEWFVEGENIRPVTIDDVIKELARNISVNGLLQSLSAIDRGSRGELFIGFRRLAAIQWAVGEKLIAPDMPVPVMLYSPDTPLKVIKAAQTSENIHRKDITDVQLYQAVKELESLGMTRDEIAHALARSKSSVCKYFAPDKVTADAKEHFMAGRLAIHDCYQISIADDPAAKLAAFLGKKRGKPEPTGNEPPQKTARLKIPLAVSNDKYSAAGIVTLSSLPGEEIDWPRAENLLKEALRSVREAQKEKWTLKSAMETWKAVASPKAADDQPHEGEDPA